MSQNIEASYPISPTQLGMLFHRLNAPRAAKDLFQIACRWKHNVDISALRAAWEAATRRHPTLRFAFRWEGLAEPVQDIHREVTIPFNQEDLRQLEPSQQSQRVGEYLESDRREGFLADQPPLYRIKLFQLGDADYMLVYTIHHALLDGRSLILIIKETFDYYEAYLRGEEPNFEPLPRPYRDYVEWCQHYDPPQAETFWRELLRGFAAPTSLTVDKPLGAAQTLEASYGEQDLCLLEPVTTALHNLAASSRVTMNTLLQAAWAVLLSRYSGEEDVVFGATRACRQSSIEGTGDMIGPMVNTLPVRVRVSPEGSLASLLKELREQHLRVRDYEQIPVAKIQRWTDLPGGVAPFDTGVVFHNYSYQGTFRYQPGIWPDREFHLYPNLIFSANVMVYNEPRLRVKIIYDRNRLDDVAVERMLGHLRTLLEGIAAHPDRRLGELPLLTAAERHQLLVEWGNNTTDYPRDLSLHELFEQTEARSPEALAVVEGDRHLTYRDLNLRANQVANHLRSLGVKSGDRVGIYMVRSLEMMIGLLGIIKTGAAYLPLDADYPHARLSFMLADSQVSVVLTQDKLAGNLAGFGGTLIRLDTDSERLRQASDDNPPVSATAEDLAYVIYTSGSTGTPKAVAIPQRAVNRLLFHSDYVQLTSTDRIAQMSNASFDAATFEIWGAWLFGGQLVIIPKELALSPKALGIRLRESGVTTMFITTLLFNHIAMEEPAAFRTLKQVLFGGEAVDPRWAREVLLKGGPQRLLHVYGPTETTTFALWHLIEQVDENAKTIPIGKPISNTQAYVLDRCFQPVPIGIPGQLCLSGDGLARGYENRPELTAEKFVPNPFASPHIPGTERMYLTGDLVRYLADGSIEFLGRIDRQIKIRGFRVELGEIEVMLRRHPSIQECAVILREDSPGDKRLVAYVVTSEASQLNITELRRFLEVELPEYMVPAAFVPLNALPLSATGKIDAHALPVPDRLRPALADRYLAPRTSTEETLAAIWADVLGLERVGIEDNFFDLGGDSILSIQVVSRANRAGLKLTPRQIFHHQTIARLAADAGSVATTAAEQGPVTGPAPLTPVQCWFFEQEFPSPHHFNQSMLLSLRPGVDPALLSKAVSTLVAHHDALRMRYTLTADGWSQVNAGLEGLAQLEVTDISQLPAGEQQAAVAGSIARLQASLNLSQGPLARFHLFQGGPREADRLFIVIHHLVIDGVSWRILLEDLETVYDQLRQRKDPGLAPKTTSFKAWAGHMLEHAQSVGLRQELEYWVSQSLDQLPLPVSEARYRAGSTGCVTVSLSAEETRALLQDVPATYQTRINDVLLTPLLWVISKWTGSRSVRIDLEGHGREEIFEGIDISRTVGWFTSIFPVSLCLDEGADVGQALKSTKEQLRRIPNNGIGYGLLHYMNRDPEVAAKLHKSAPAQLSFNYLGQFDQIFTGSSLFGLSQPQLELSQDASGHASHGLSINASIVQGRLMIGWSYNEKIHARATVESLAQNYIEMLRALIKHCQSPDTGGFTPSDFPEAGLNQEELDALLGELDD